MRPLIVILALALAVLQFRLWVADGGFREVWRLEAQVEQRTNENGRLAERNAALAAEVQDLKAGLAAAEERARSELGMVLPDESFYQIVPYEGIARSGDEEPSADVERGEDAGRSPSLSAGAARPDGPSAPAEQHVDGAAAAVSSIR